MSIGDPRSDREQADADNTAAVASQTAASSERESMRQQQSTDHEITVGRLDTLTEAIKAQSESNTQLALATVEYQERARTATRRFRIQMLTVAIVFALLYWRQGTSIDSGHSTGKLIADCVQPGGKCFQQSETRTASVVGQLVAALDADGIVRAACAQAESANVTASVERRIADMTACVAAHSH